MSRHRMGSNHLLIIDNNVAYFKKSEILINYLRVFLFVSSCQAAHIS